VVDAGVAHDFGAARRADRRQGGAGTANYIEQPAMTAAQCAQAIEQGAGIVLGLAAAGCNVVGFGEMGIGNTAAASLLTHCLTGLPLAECVGRGTGLDDAGLARKQDCSTRRWSATATAAVTMIRWRCWPNSAASRSP
jgi:nicotinate-nucleotide--dimethylbenzimidazole phosphoribosyltransferase